jgi:hypothetical protein
VDARCTPSRILGHYSEDQLTHLLRSLLAPDWFLDSGNQLPIQAKTSPVPSDDSFRCDDNKGLLPSAPESASDDPEEPIKYLKPWPAMLPFQHCELLAKSEIFK